MTVLALRFQWAIVLVVLPKVYSDVTTMKNMYYGHAKINAAFYKVRREAVEAYLGNYFEDCHGNSFLKIPEQYPENMLNTSCGDAVAIIMYGSFETDALDDLPSDLRHLYNTSFEKLEFHLGFLEKDNTTFVKIPMAQFTDSPTAVFPPFFGEKITYIEEIVRDSNGTVILRNGSDVMKVVLPTRPCIGGDDIPSHTKEWRDVRATLWTLRRDADWSICERLNWSGSVCQKLKGHLCGLSRVGGDFCYKLREVKGKSRRCKSSIRVEEIAGIFKKAALLSEEEPLEPFDAEWIEGHLENDIIYPCLRQNILT